MLRGVSKKVSSKIKGYVYIYNMGKVQSNTTCNIHTARRYLHSLSQQLHVSAFI